MNKSKKKLPQGVAGGKALFKKRGSAYMRKIGKKGRAAQVKK